MTPEQRAELENCVRRQREITDHIMASAVSHGITEAEVADAKRQMNKTADAIDAALAEIDRLTTEVEVARINFD